MRELFLSELVKDVLGPRNGVYETINGDPKNEYITGVLSPRDAPPERDPDTDAEMTASPEDEVGFISYEEDVDERDIISSALFQPFLDPKALPHSIGLSFLITAGKDDPAIKLCVTWARYFPQDETKRDVWKRFPRFWISPVITITGDKQHFYIDKSGNQVPEQGEAEVSLHVISRSVERDVWHVTIYLVNEIRKKRDFAITEEHIFQPQIRIRCLDGSEILPLRMEIKRDPEEEEIDLLYNNRLLKARGHMCSAIWKEIDPERPHTDSKIEAIRPKAPPFYWVDGDFVETTAGKNARDEFTCPDVRTEFVPVYPVESPLLFWDKKWGDPPELRAEVLAEMWNPDEIETCLAPLIHGYKMWIDSLRADAAKFSGRKKQIADRLLNRCIAVLDRMEKGLNLLLNDTDARLAFCFANKAMDLQARWGREEGLTWYPYQLAFILTVLESVANHRSSEREVCDLLWVPTGAGKTEAYLAVAAFIMAYRRRRALRRASGDRTGGGVSVISRYTLRLLTIQQFRRTLRMITACEYLRVFGLTSGGPVGWRPEKCPLRDDFIWGSTRFSIGLWVGGNVTPNRLRDSHNPVTRKPIYGAISILKGSKGEGEPAQVMNCPVCKTILAVPERGLEADRQHTVHLLIRSSSPVSVIQQALENYTPPGNLSITLDRVSVQQVSSLYHVLTLVLSSSRSLRSEDIDDLWGSIQRHLSGQSVGTELVPARASRPGYFILHYLNVRGRREERNFEIYCPDPDCQLNRDVLWVEGVPADCGWLDIGRRIKIEADRNLQNIQYKRLQTGKRILELPDGTVFRMVPEWCRASLPGTGIKMHTMYISTRIPIPALTVDEQIYCYPPSFLVATVDKFARLPFESRCSAIFGNVEFYHARFGYYRQHIIPYSADGSGQSGHPFGSGSGQALHVRVEPFDPPDLIIQDELHLIEGPLGSLVGIYETAVEYLCRANEHAVKYIASTATVKRANDQVGSLFIRRLLQFPPPGLTADDRFFLRFRETHPLDDERPGRLYAGICAPGRGPHTPTVRIWSRLLQTAEEIAQRHHHKVDPFWTLVGYFNAVRELAGARNLYRQDIPERVRIIAAGRPRSLSDDRAYELSSRTPSTDLPSILTILGEKHYPNDPDALFTTSMFGTGVDVGRLSLMVVHGQPKATSAYIQATGRVGRNRGGLVVTFYRATRPRDLSHYEFFCGYHRALERFMEDLTVSPFSQGALDRSAGPVSVGILRNMRNCTIPWGRDQSAVQMATNRHAPEVVTIPSVFERRAQSQPAGRRPAAGTVQRDVEAKLDRWQQEGSRNSNMVYVEYFTPQKPVVLGDPRHQHTGLPVVYRNAPQSLRDIEETTGFET